MVSTMAAEAEQMVSARGVGVGTRSEDPGWTCSECSEPHRGKPNDCDACGQPVCVLCRRVGPHKSPRGEWCRGERSGDE